ncbi:MAG TPA: hypothetical protein PKU97_19060, partial [Kofleriaceae bacterium]|nr:hypothetical protein [Kofleriaceae bacterium]
MLAPQFLLGFTFPEHVDRYLAVAGVDELRVASDESAVVYCGRVTFGGNAGASPVREHRDPSGAVFQWEDVAVEFRLTIPRDGASFVHDGVELLARAPASQSELRDLFNALGPVEQTSVTTDYPYVAGTEYPGVRFRLELMLSLLTFHLGNDWGPGVVADNHRIVADPSATSQDVKFVLPKMVFEYEQGDDVSRAPSFRLKSWGNAGFDAPSDLATGEFVRMEPAIALHRSGRIAFGIDQAIIDLSPDHTPPEILEHFGTDEGFQGLYLK